jgi:transcriptional regulator with XRE-family HTH domain
MSKRRKPLHRAIGEELRRIREKRGWRQEDLARELRRWDPRWTRASVAALERGGRNLTVAELFMIAEAVTGVSIEDLLPREGEEVEIAPGRTVPPELLQRRLKLRDYVLRAETIVVNLSGEARGEAEEKIARKLGVTALAVVEAAHSLWGRTLATERDRRLAEQAKDVTPRRRQALRGHVTRSLVAELRPLLKKKDEAPRQ